MDRADETEIASAVAGVLAIEAAPSLDPPALANRVRECLEKQVTAVIKQAERGVDHIELHTDRDEYFFVGYAGSTCRLLLHLTFEQTSRVATVTLRATKGQRDAVADVDWGDRDHDVGNSLLVACVLHVGLVELRRGGLLAIENHPYNDRLRGHYTAMGFNRGERLELDRGDELTRAFRFIAEIYGKYGISLRAPPT